VEFASNRTSHCVLSNLHTLNSYSVHAHHEQLVEDDQLLILDRLREVTQKAVQLEVGVCIGLCFLCIICCASWLFICLVLESVFISVCSH